MSCAQHIRTLMIKMFVDVLVFDRILSRCIVLSPLRPFYDRFFSCFAVVFTSHSAIKWSFWMTASDVSFSPSSPYHLYCTYVPFKWPHEDVYYDFNALWMVNNCRRIVKNVGNRSNGKQRQGWPRTMSSGKERQPTVDVGKIRI